MFFSVSESLCGESLDFDSDFEEVVEVVEVVVVFFSFGDFSPFFFSFPLSTGPVKDAIREKLDLKVLLLRSLFATSIVSLLRVSVPSAGINPVFIQKWQRRTLKKISV